MEAKENKSIAKIIFFIFTLILAVLDIAFIVISLITDRQMSLLHIAASIASIVMFLGVFVYAVWGYDKPHGNLLRYCYLLYAAGTAVSVLSDIQLGSYNTASVALVLQAAFLSVYVGGRLHKIRQNHVIAIVGAVLLVMSLFLPKLLPAYEHTATPASVAERQYTDEAPEDEAPDGEAPDGEAPDGEKPDGEKPDRKPSEKPGEQPEVRENGERPADAGMTLPECLNSNRNEVTALVLWLCLFAAYFLRYKEHKLAGLED